MIPNIDSEPIDTPSTKLRREKKLRSISGAAVRRSTISRTVNAAAASTSGPMTASGADPTRGKAWSVKTIETIAVASRMKPSQSVVWLVEPSRCAGAGRAAARPADAMHISGMFNQNIARQPAVWVSRPPNNGPTLKPSIKNPLQAPIYTARRCGVAPVPTAASVLGTAKAAERPCRARPANNVVSPLARAMTQDATPNSARPATDTWRAPNRSAALPPSTMKDADTTR